MFSHGTHGTHRSLGCVSSVEGIIDNDVDRSIRNLTSIGAEAMNRTDEMVLDIMTHKSC